MALRMNLYGCDLKRFLDVLGSKNTSARSAAETCLSESLTNPVVLGKARAWLGRLIDEGYPLRSERPQPSVSEDGSLLVTQLETELHAVVVYSLMRTLFKDACLDLSRESSTWHYSAIVAFDNELGKCGFMRSKECPTMFIHWMSALTGGSPLFGDGFRSDWSFYTVLKNDELTSLVGAIETAQKFEKHIPDSYPETFRKASFTKLSDAGNQFARAFGGWLRRIQQAGQDAFIYWW